MVTRVPIDEEMLPPFQGFPKECLTFLRALKRNNNRPWFQARKGQYEEFVRFPMQCLIASLAERMRDTAPEMEFNPRKSIFRIYRDVRFSNNKAPYKTNIAASFGMRGKKGPTDTPGLYLGVEPGEVYIGGGLYMPTGSQLKGIRSSIVRNPDEWLSVVENHRFVKTFGGIEGEKLSRAPLGYPVDHAMIDYLKHKQFYTGVVLEERTCLSPKFLDNVVRVFVDIMPLVRWLSKAVG